MIALINPDSYHGKRKKHNFFEGWYFKLCTKDNSRSLAFIPGISLANKRDAHCFIQILDGNNKTYNYIKYSKSQFKAYDYPFKINVSNSIFSLDKLELNIHKDNLDVISNLTFKNLFKWNDSLVNPGSMGFYNYIPFMECYSQVCALTGDITGTLIINNECINFDGGKIYIEKDWGSSFPLEWVWVQCNSFINSNATVTCSLGRVPLFNTSFQGFLIGVTVNNIFYKFTTINRSKFNLSFKDGISITATNKNLKLYFKTTSSEDQFILCYGPKNGVMTPFVRESITSKLYMKLIDLKKSKIIYEGIGINTGIEYGGRFLEKSLNQIIR